MKWHKIKRISHLAGFTFLGLGLIGTGYLTFLPSPIEPVAYNPQPGLSLENALATNETLIDAELWGDGKLSIPEDIAFDSQGRLYTATGDGQILRIARDTDGKETIEQIAEVGGHPLGLVMGNDDILYVANHGVGLQAVSLNGTVRLLTDRYRDRPIRFADDLDVSSDGIVYFSDASAKFNNSTLDTGPPYLPLDLLEARPHGTLYSYDTRTGETQMLLDGLYFANGVALTQDESAVLVVETPRYRIRRLWLTGAKAGTSDIFTDRLPGLADGITSDRQGNQYVTIQTLRTTLIDDILHPRPWAKAMLTKLPKSLWVRPRPYGLVIVYDETGKPVTSLQDPEGEVVFSVANAVPYRDKLYLGTLSNDAIVVVPNPIKRTSN